MKWLHDTITGRNRGIFAKLFRSLMLPLSWIFGTIVVIRRGLYDLGLCRARALPVPVVCVGNIVAGGTGKTPLVMRIASVLNDLGVKTAVLCSGYGGKARQPIVVSDGEQLLSDLVRAGDEAIMIARRLNEIGIPVIAGRDRYKAGLLALSMFEVDLLIMDDGMQHLRLKRDVDIAVFDSRSPLGNGRLIPAGPMREPLSAIRSVDAIIRTGTEEIGSSPALAHLIDYAAKLSKPIIQCTSRPSMMHEIGNTRRQIDPRTLSGKNVLAVCGIGRPESFERTLRELGAYSTLIPFPDHHRYSRSDAERLTELASGYDCLVTTAKDEDKLASLGISGFVVEIELDMNDEQLIEIIREKTKCRLSKR